MKRREGGFTLIEVIVVAGIISVLAGILVPLIFKEIDESKVSAAKADIRSISSALIVLKKDTGQWPVSATCNAGATIMIGTGNMPTLTGAGWDNSAGSFFDQVLNSDANGCWPAPGIYKGPYFASVNPDPWGNNYMMNANDLVASSTSPVWIMSAGPNGIVETASSASVIDKATSDDEGIRIR